VERGEIDTKLAPYYYRPEFRQNLEALAGSTHPNRVLGDLIEEIHYGAGVPPEYSNEGILFIRAMNIRDGRFDLSDIVYLDESVHPGLDRYRLREDDLVMVRSGVNVGDTCRVPAQLAGSVNGSYSITFRVGRDLNPEYVSLFLNSRFGKLQVARVSGRSAQPNINSQEICGLKAVVPPRPIQDAIADKMDAAYRRKRELEAEAGRLLATIDEYVLNQVGHDWGADPHSEEGNAGPASFTVWRHRVSRLDPKRYRWQGEMEDTEVLRPLGTLLTARREKVDRDKYDFGNLQLITLHFDGTIEPRDIPSWRTDVKGTLYFAQPGDLIYSKIDARNGAISLVPNELGRVAVTSEYPVYQVKEELILAAYLKLILRSSRLAVLLKALASGHSGRKRIYPDQVENIQVPVPAIEKQQEIADEVQRRIERAAVLQQEAERIVAEAKSEVERMILGTPSPPNEFDG